MSRMSDKPTFVPATGTLGWIEHIYLTEGPQAAEVAYEQLLPGAATEVYRIFRKGEGVPTSRPEIGVQDAISYSNYGPPALWGAPFSISLMRLQNVRKQDEYVFHPGEEIVVPMEGSVDYSFFWSPGSTGLRRDIVQVETGEIARINPLLPHHGWSAQKSAADAFLALFHDADSSVVFDLDYAVRKKRTEERKADETRRRVNSSELKEPGHFVLRVWGIADRIRTQRQRASLTIQQLADLVGIDSSHLSRIENASTNVSIDVLTQICTVLRIDILPRVHSTNWNCVRSQFSRMNEAMCLVQPQMQFHHLHPRNVVLYENRPIAMETIGSAENFASWIVMEGRFILELKEPFNRSEILERGAVIHFRKNVHVRTQPLEQSRILRIGVSDVRTFHDSRRTD
jgi:transcriptional regulator with XRE-family HTH domain